MSAAVLKRRFARHLFEAADETAGIIVPDLDADIPDGHIRTGQQILCVLHPQQRQIFQRGHPLSFLEGKAEPCGRQFKRISDGRHGDFRVVKMLLHIAHDLIDFVFLFRFLFDVFHAAEQQIAQSAQHIVQIVDGLAGRERKIS